MQPSLPHILCIAALSLTQSSPGDRAAEGDGPRLGEALPALRALALDEEWAELEERALALLDAAVGRDELHTYWGEYAELLELADFWQGHDVPEPEDVFRGDLRRWRERSGDIELVYEREEGHLEPREDGGVGDLLPFHDLLAHPALFRGAYTIELQGETLSHLPALLVEMRFDRMSGTANGSAYSVLFEGNGVSARTFTDGEYGAAEFERVNLERRRPFRIRVRVASNSIKATYNGKIVARMDRERGPYGQIALARIDSVDRMEIKGQVDPAWVAGRLDAHVGAAMEEHITDWSAFHLVSDEVRDAILQPFDSMRWFHFVCPERETNSQLFSRLEDLARAVSSEELTLEQAIARTRNPTNCTPSEKKWFEALHGWNKSPMTSRQLVREIVEEHPLFFEGYWLSLAFDGVLTPTELRQAVDRFPTYVNPWMALTRRKLVFEGPGAAREILHEAAIAGIPGVALREPSLTISRARYGPLLRGLESCSTKHYEVRTDLDQATALRVAALLEDYYRRFNGRFRRVDEEAVRPLQVTFFSGQASYDRYARDLLSAEPHTSLGLYSAPLKQLLVWNNSDPEQTDATLRHEGFHQYFDALVGDSPIWLNEGLAQLFEQARFEGSRFITDLADPDDLVVLANTDWTDLQELVRMGPEEFMLNPGLHYPQAWALVHYLEHGGLETRGILDALVDALAEGASNRKAVERAFAEVDWPELERGLRRHVAQLRD